MHVAQAIEAENLAPISQILTQARNATAESMPFLPTCSPNKAFTKKKRKIISLSGKTSYYHVHTGS